DKNLKNNKGFERLNDGYYLKIIGGVLIASAIFIIINMFIAGTVLISVLNSLGEESPGLGFGNMLLAGFGVVRLIYIGLTLMRKGKHVLSKKNHWYLILYPDHFLFKYPVDNVMKEANLPLSDIQKCYFISSRKGSYNIYSTKPRIKFEFSINIHLEFKVNNETQFVSMPLANRYQELNKIFSYLQDDKNIPIYFNKEKIKIKESRQPFETLDTHTFERIEFD